MTDRGVTGGLAARNKSRQRGIVLIVVLWMTASLALLVSSFNASVQSDLRQTEGALIIARKRALSRAAVELAAAKLFVADKQNGWRAQASPYRLVWQGGRVSITITDMAGLIDLNCKDPQLLSGLIARHVEAASRVAAVVDRIQDWRDEDHDPRPEGAEDTDYRRNGLPLGAGDGDFTDVTQLQRVHGMTPHLYRQIRPFITVHNGDCRVNPVSAPGEVLASLPGATEGDVTDIMRLRTVYGDDDSWIETSLPRFKTWLTRRSGPAYRVRIEMEGVNASFFGVSEAVITKGTGGRSPFLVLAWDEQALTL